MIDFSVSEILVVVLVALLVMKPEQIPEVAFTLGRVTKTVRHLLSKIKDLFDEQKHQV